jgi:hypothetical protein
LQQCRAFFVVWGFEEVEKRSLKFINSPVHLFTSWIADFADFKWILQMEKQYGILKDFPSCCQQPTVNGQLSYMGFQNRVKFISVAVSPLL